METAFDTGDDGGDRGGGDDEDGGSCEDECDRVGHSGSGVKGL